MWLACLGVGEQTLWGKVSMWGKYKTWTPGHGPPIFTIPKITDVNNDKRKIRKLKKNEFTVIFQININ